MSQIQPGDIVRLVWGCCPGVRALIGWIGTVESIEYAKPSRCAQCDDCRTSTVAYCCDGVHDVAIRRQDRDATHTRRKRDDDALELERARLSRSLTRRPTR